MLFPMLRGSLVPLRKVTPWAYGWCGTPRRCATLALTLPATRGIRVSVETMRR